MGILFFVIFVFISSFLFAKVEIAIEGPNGWAEKLPTWRIPKGNWINKLLFGNRVLTGYHVWMISFLLFFVHIVYLFMPFSRSVELRLISALILFWLTEDFLWFVLNPAFGLRNFKKDKIWWHRDNWWWIAPRDYFIFLPFSICLYILSLM